MTLLRFFLIAKKLLIGICIGVIVVSGLLITNSVFIIIYAVNDDNITYWIWGIDCAATALICLFGFAIYGAEGNEPLAIQNWRGIGVVIWCYVAAAAEMVNYLLSVYNPQDLEFLHGILIEGFSSFEALIMGYPFTTFAYLMILASLELVAIIVHQALRRYQILGRVLEKVTFLNSKDGVRLFDFLNHNTFNSWIKLQEKAGIPVSIDLSTSCLVVKGSNASTLGGGSI